MHLGPFAFEYFKGRTTAVPASMAALATGYHFFPRFVLVIICHCQAAFRPSLLLRLTDGYQIRYAPQTICHARGLHRPDRWRKVAARRHPIPDLVKILLQLLLKIFDRLLIDPCCSLICFHLFARFPDLLLGNTKQLCLIHRAPPIAGWLIESGSLTQRLGSLPLPGTSQLLRAVPPLSLRFRTLALVVLPLVASPFASKSQVPTFRSTASLASSGHLSCRMPLRP
jgi:hypothetical protein